MTVKEAIDMLSFDTQYILKGSYSGKIWHKSYHHTIKHLESFLNYKITDDAFFATLYCPTDLYSSPFAKPVIGIWFYDYDLCKEKGVHI